MSGTPYVKTSFKIEENEIKLNQIQDIVYNYPLNQGIGRFLKIPDIKEAELEEKSFIKLALTDFFNNFDKNYANGTKSKVAFYCPLIETLNEEILPVIKEWYSENRPQKQDEIFVYYGNPQAKKTASKEEKERIKSYQLPKDSKAIFENLDKPYSNKRVILLVDIGKEGWDCKSLTGVVLQRPATTKNFVLQTTCRCLREVTNASEEKALIYLSKTNYKILDKELKENYQLSISDLKLGQSSTLNAIIRKPKLGKLKYKQIRHQYKLVKSLTASPEEVLKSYDFDYYINNFRYDTDITKSKIGGSGLTDEVKEKANIKNAEKIEFIDFIYTLGGYLYGKYNETELLSKYKEDLSKINGTINSNINWITNNPYISLKEILKDTASNFADSIKYEKETIKNDVEIELLEWKTENPEIECINSNGRVYKLMPKLKEKDIRNYKRHPEDIEEDYFKQDKTDPQDISFNYVPYRMDSEFEQNALTEMLKLSELTGLEVYFNGFKDKELQTFYIETPRGKYTPDFLVLKRKDKKKYKNKDTKGDIEKILILETKGKPYYNEEFQAKEKFVKEEFIKYNPNFIYHCCLDESGDNDFSRHVDKFKQLIKNF